MFHAFVFVSVSMCVCVSISESNTCLPHSMHSQIYFLNRLYYTLSWIPQIRQSIHRLSNRKCKYSSSGILLLFFFVYSTSKQYEWASGPLWSVRFFSVTFIVCSIKGTNTCTNLANHRTLGTISSCGNQYGCDIFSTFNTMIDCFIFKEKFMFTHSLTHSQIVVCFV